MNSPKISHLRPFTLPSTACAVCVRLAGGRPFPSLIFRKKFDNELCLFFGHSDPCHCGSQSDLGRIDDIFGQILPRPHDLQRSQRSRSIEACNFARPPAYFTIQMRTDVMFAGQVMATASAGIEQLGAG